MPIDPKAEGILVLGGLRKKYLTRCQILKLSLCSLTKSVFQNIVKDLFKSI